MNKDLEGKLSPEEGTSSKKVEEDIEKSSKNPRNIPPGILRLDIGKPRRLSTEFKFVQGEPTSPQPSIDRLSVTFAEDSVKSDSSTKCNYVNFQTGSGSGKMEKVHFPQNTDEEDSDQEDYSASVNAIIQRRASTRRSRRRSVRRTSSPFTPDVLPGAENGRRRSSVYTTSSGDTAITMDENLNQEVTQEEIFENIKLHKEVLSNVKMQPWNMRKKLKLVVQAKAYIKKHEGALQERLAHSHSTKDMLASWNIYLIKKWQRWKRELTNLSMWFIPWELKIKEIESHFGSVVASYFLFLRWLFWVNIVISVAIISFVTIPEIILTPSHATDQNITERKLPLPEEKYNATNFLTLWDFEGVFKYSPLFYGYYMMPDEKKFGGYKVPTAYFVTGLVVYAYSFFATLRKMAENSRMSKLSEKDDECIFSWKLFTAWDYMIGNAETAHNRVASIVMGFKEALLEEAEKNRESRNWKVICFRVLVNTAVVCLLSFSVFAVIVVVKRSTEPEANSSVWRRNEITVVMSLITLFFPMLFEVLGFVEQYHPRKQLRLQLARIMVLNLLNLYSLIFALFDKISDMTQTLQEFKNISQLTAAESTALSRTTVNAFTTTGPTTVNAMFDNAKCYCTGSPDSGISDLLQTTTASLAVAVLANVSSSFAKNVSKIANINGTEHFGVGRKLLQFNDTQQNLSSYSFSNVTYLEENFTFFHENYSSFDGVNDNQTFNANVTNLLDAKESFIDYLTYVLSEFADNTTSFNISSLNQSGLLLNITENFTDFSNLTNEKFNIVVQQFLNVSETFPDEDERFETTEYEETTETTTKFYPTVYSGLSETSQLTTPQFDSYCTEYCNSQRLLEVDSTVSLPATSVTTTLSVGMNYSQRAKLRSLCWETMFGQELIKLTVMDLILTIFSTLAMDFFRGIFVRVMNRCWCWDLEKTFPQYGDFKVAENILHLVNNQGMVWMGMFFSPGLVVLNVVKLYIMMYLRTWAVLTCNVPHEVIFRASRSNNFYYALLLMMLFLCVLPVGYAIVQIEPSWHCGPFSHYNRIFRIFTQAIKRTVPDWMHNALDYIASPGIIIPLLVLLILIIYYMVSLTGALREANNDLKIQLRRERTEERRKMFQMADRRRRGGSGESNDFSATPFTKWKKLMGTLPTGKSIDDTPRQESVDQPPPYKDEKTENKGKDFFSKLIKKALGKSSTSEEDPNAEDGTDNEQHDSLPYDLSRETRATVHKKVKKTTSTTSSSNNNEFNVLVHRVLSLKKSNGDNDSNTSNKKVLLTRRDTLELQTKTKLMRNFAEQSKSSASRQDSGASNWSDNIPVIKISKTESAENILDEMSQKSPKVIDEVQDDESAESSGAVESYRSRRFKPKIKCALKKQTTEVDEEIICHFEIDLQKMEAENELIRSLAEETLDQDDVNDDRSGTSLQLFEENVSEKSNSDDTTEVKGSKSSEDTVLHSPFLVQKGKLNTEEILVNENLQESDSAPECSKESA